MRVLTSSTRDLERWLLRRGVGALVAGRCRCGSCHRTPLVGEHVHLYEGGRLLCDLCRRARREAPASSRRVRSAEFGQAVRDPAHAAAA
jgi:hypothetical protein